MSSTAIYENPSAALRAPRRLGGYFAPTRNLYMLYMPLGMLAAALVCWLIETDLMLAFGSVVLSIISLYMLFDVTVREAPLRITTLLAMTLGLGYGLGSANSWFTIPRTGISLGEFLHHDPAILTHTMGSVLFSLAVLTAVGELVEKPLFGLGFELEIRPQAIVFISIGLLIILIAYAAGSLNYMGVTAGENGQLGIFASFADWLVGTLFAISVIATLNAKRRGLRRYLWVLTAVQFFLQIPLGRRNLIYTMVLAVLSVRLGRFRFSWSWPKRIMIGILLSGLLYVATIAFFYLRVAGFSKAHLGIIDRISLAFSYFENNSYSEFSKQFSKNVQQRTFILGFLAELEDLSTRFTPGYGVDLYRQAISAVPSILYPDKDRNLGEEGLANSLFGTAYWDEANSVLTAGAIDFGLLGMVVYPLASALILRFLLEIIAEGLPTFVATFVILGTIGHVLRPENNLTDYIIIIRNGLLFSVVVWFFVSLPAFRLRKEH